MSNASSMVPSGLLCIRVAIDFIKSGSFFRVRSHTDGFWNHFSKLDFE